MAFAACALAFPVVLALHNLDEYARRDAFAAAYRLPLPAGADTRRALRNGAVLLTLAAAALGVAAWLRLGGIPAGAARLAVFALLLNGLGHLLMSMRRRRLLPGSGSALLLVLPYSALAIAAMRADGDAPAALARCAALGALAMPPAALAFLWLGYGLARLAPRR